SRSPRSRPMARFSCGRPGGSSPVTSKPSAFRIRRPLIRRCRGRSSRHRLKPSPRSSVGSSTLTDACTTARSIGTSGSGQRQKTFCAACSGCWRRSVCSATSMRPGRAMKQSSPTFARTGLSRSTTASRCTTCESRAARSTHSLTASASLF
ncbi:MAG: hypothetical protein E6G57_01325, partial [Actinobacteria bacterium]